MRSGDALWAERRALCRHLLQEGGVFYWQLGRFSGCECCTVLLLQQAVALSRGKVKEAQKVVIDGKLPI